MYWNRCGVRLEAHNAPVGEQAHNLFWAWEQIAPLLAYAKEDPRGKGLWVSEHCYALCTRQFQLCHALRVDLMLLRFRHRCGASASHYLLFLEEDCDTLLDIADAFGVGLVALSGDILESTH